MVSNMYILEVYFVIKIKMQFAEIVIIFYAMSTILIWKNDENNWLGTTNLRRLLSLGAG